MMNRTVTSTGPFPIVVPAKAGTQNAFKGWRAEGLDSRFRGNDCMPLQLLDNAQVLSYLSTNNWFRISFVIGHFSDRGCSR